MLDEFLENKIKGLKRKQVSLVTGVITDVANSVFTLVVYLFTKLPSAKLITNSYYKPKYCNGRLQWY